MGRWLQRLKTEIPQDEVLTKPPKLEVKALTVGNVSFVCSLYGPFQKLNDILLSSPFTLEMILEGLKLWKQPFDEFDLDMIQEGRLSSQQVIDYLSLWEKTYPIKFQKLQKV